MNIEELSNNLLFKRFIIITTLIGVLIACVDGACGLCQFIVNVVTVVILLIIINNIFQDLFRVKVTNTSEEIKTLQRKLNMIKLISSEPVKYISQDIYTTRSL